MKRRCWHHKWKEGEMMQTIHCPASRCITQRPMLVTFCVYCGDSPGMARDWYRRRLLMAVQQAIRIVARAS